MRRSSEAGFAPYAMLMGASILWSTGGVLIKWVQWHPLAISGTRSAISAVVLLVFLRKPRFSWSLSQFGSALSYAATVMLFVGAMKLTTAANAIVLQYTAPAYTALFSGIFLNEKVGWYDWCAVAAVMGGMFLFFFDRLSPGSFRGNLIAIASGLTMAWLFLFLRKQDKESTIESVLLGNAMTAVFCFPFMFGQPPSLQGWLGLALLGIFQLGFSYILFATAIRYVRALDAVLICTIEPLLNPIWVLLAFGERPGRWALAGGAVIIAAVTLRAVLETLVAERMLRTAPYIRRAVNHALRRVIRRPDK